jgi:replicative DNA helicase
VPQAIEAEQAVIGALLRNNAGGDLMGSLAPALFMRHAPLIFTEVMRRVGAGQPADVISVGLAVSAAVPDALAYLNGMAQSCPSEANMPATSS